MKTILFLAMLLQMMVQMPIEESASTSDRYCIIANPDGRLLEAANGDETQSVASISKIMTAIVALEQSDQTDTWQVSKDIDAHATGSSIYLKPQQEVSMEALLYGSMLRSGNDAAIAIAEAISGSVEEFASLMNEEALALGATQSHFVNPNGLPDENHYTSVYDLYLMFRAALENELFVDIISTKSYVVSYTDAQGNPVEQNWENTNQYLSGHSEPPEGFQVIGGKNGDNRGCRLLSGALFAEFIRAADYFHCTESGRQIQPVSADE